MTYAGGIILNLLGINWHIYFYFVGLFGCIRKQSVPRMGKKEATRKRNNRCFPRAYVCSLLYTHRETHLILQLLTAYVVNENKYVCNESKCLREKKRIVIIILSSENVMDSFLTQEKSQATSSWWYPHFTCADVLKQNCDCSHWRFNWYKQDTEGNVPCRYI